MEQPNVLFLDEPTNDLDISTLTVLEDYINHFNGTVITVSHDRYFLDKVADKLLIFDGNGRIERYSGQFTEYLANQKKSQPSGKKSAPKPKPVSEAPVKQTKTKLTYKEQLEWDGIEDEIDDLEKKKADLQAKMNQNGDNYDKLATLQSDFEATDKELDEKMARWDYLSQYVE
jgi:ATPase components of ABC transporters with duplicated ATPase domains